MSIDGFNSQMFEISRENELAEVLSHYNSEYIFSVIHDTIARAKLQSFSVMAIPNVVSAWEQNFKAILDRYGRENLNEVSRVRNDTYREIINIICKEYNLNFTVADVDLFSAANKLYQLFICDFRSLIVEFFCRYIYKERSSIYESMHLGELKKNKDTSNIYSKKIYKDPKIAVINAYINDIITNLCGMDFDLYTIINIAITSKELVQYYINLISPAGDFFKDIIVPIMQTEYRATIITDIRFKFYDMAIAHDQIMQINIASQEEEENERNE